MSGPGGAGFLAPWPRCRRYVGAVPGTRSRCGPVRARTAASIGISESARTGCPSVHEPIYARIRSRTHSRCSWSGQTAYQYVQPETLTGTKKGDGGVASQAASAWARALSTALSPTAVSSLGGEKKLRVKADQAASELSAAHENRPSNSVATSETEPGSVVTVMSSPFIVTPL